jgi:hypothetical protein
MRVRRSAVAPSRRSVVFAGAVGAVAAVAVLALLGVLGVLGPGALTLLPALLLAAALFAGRFPGERMLERWTRARPAVRRAVARLVLPPTRAAGATPRGGRLVAAALAGRAPPALAAG